MGCECDQEEADAAHPNTLILVSSYTEKLGHVGSPSVPHSHGITALRHVPASDNEQSSQFGTLVVENQLDAGPNPSYLCLNQSSHRLYVVNECEGSPDKGNLLSAYSLDVATGDITLINSSECGGTIACHVSLSPDERFLAVAMYGGGSVAVFRVRDDGGIGERTALCAQEGEVGPDTDRQEASHAHMVQFDSTGERLLCCDLGLDQVSVYSMDTETGGLTRGSSVDLPAGSGPRHLVFHPTEPFVFILNELLSTVVAAEWDSGTLKLIGQPLPTVPGDNAKVGVGGNTFCAAVKTSADGRFLYASNRGHDSISVFSIDSHGGLSYVSSCWTDWSRPEASHEATWPPLDCPRDFALCGPRGEWVLVGNQDSDSVVVLSRDVSTGALSPAGVQVQCPAPVCVVSTF